MDIRKYNFSDLNHLTELMEDLGYPTTSEKMKARMEVMEATPSYFTFVAIKDERVVGMVGCRDIYYYEDDGFVIQISLLITKGSYQRQGIGKALISFIEHWAIERGANSLYLTSGIKPERQKAHKFYEKMGFAITGYRFVKKL